MHESSKNGCSKRSRKKYVCYLDQKEEKRMSSIVSFLGNAVLLAIAAIVATVVAVLIIGRIFEG